MNTDMKDKIKFCTAIGTLLIIIIIVLMIVLQYQVEGEKNMPYQLSKITIISTAEGEQNKGKNTNVESGKTTEEQTTTDENAENVETENTNNAESTESAENSENNNENNGTSTEETHKWNLKIDQSNDIYFFIDKNSDSDDDILESLTIANVKVIKAPQKGIIRTYMPNSKDGRTFIYDDSYLIEDKLEYKGAKSSNIKTLEIGSKGGSAVIRISNNDIGKFVSDEDTEVKHDGTLINKIGATEDEISFKVSFDLILQINKIKYKATITLNLPEAGLSEAGTTTKEITDGFVFKRIR